jgi:glycosyltransferase involved in cell wall biosynthesis
MAITYSTSGLIHRQEATPPSNPTRVCMITHSAYEFDYRVMRYGETLVQRGDAVDVLALSRTPGAPKEETIKGVKVIRIQDRFQKSAQTKLQYLVPLLRFLFIASWELTRRHRRHRYDVVHIHNVPDFLVFAAWYPKLTGARIILDIHDIVPELFGAKFNVSERSFWIRTLKLIEKLSARFAHHVILSNHLWLQKYSSRTRKEKCSVLINHVDTSIFRPMPRRKRQNKPIIIFPGGLEWHQGLDIAIRAFHKLRQRMPEIEFHIYGDGQMKSSLIDLTKELHLDDSVRFFEPVRLNEIAEVMAQADLGVVPKRADSFGNEAFSTKIMEFMAVGVPVVASSTKIDRYYFNDSMLRFFPPGDVDAMADAMYELLSNQQLQTDLVSRAAEHAAHNNWGSRKAEYLSLIDELRAA